MPDSRNTYRAEDFDTLVDSPIIVGNPVIREFTVAGKKHYLVLEGDPSLFDADRAAADVQKIVEAGGKVMGRYDYPHYYFLNLVTEAGGGLEHKNSFLGMTGRFTTRTRRAYLGWLGPGRARVLPQLERQAAAADRARARSTTRTKYYAKALWIAEGFTDYYAGLLVAPRRSLDARRVSRRVCRRRSKRCRRRPGRLVTPVDMASYDTWIKQYRPDENTAEHDHQLLPEGRRDRVSARREDPQGHQRRQVARRRDAAGLCSATPATRATRSSSSTRR